jgi:hypothetical protein
MTPGGDDVDWIIGIVVEQASLVRCRQTMGCAPIAWSVVLAVGDHQ